jgi:hypothetical protein
VPSQAQHGAAGPDCPSLCSRVLEPVLFENSSYRDEGFSNLVAPLPIDHIELFVTTARGSAVVFC